MNTYLGEIAALSTAVCWAITSTFFTIGGKHIGSVNVNRIRLIFAVVYLSLTHLVLKGEIIPLHIEGFRWFWSGLSGIIGLALGDSFLFQALVLVGAHISMLLMSLVPIISTLIAWFMLGENLSFIKIAAIFITIGGIVLVVLNKKELKTNSTKNKYLLGIFFGIGGALGQAIGLIAAKKGLVGNFSELSGTLIRVLVATFFLWLFTLIIGKAAPVLKAVKNKRAMSIVAAGAFTGPFLGIWLSMVAIKLTYIGIASTLMALPPIILLPISHWVFKEKFTLISIIGTFIAVLGAAIIFLT